MKWILLAAGIALLYLYLIHPRMKRPDFSPFLSYFYAHRGLHNIEKGIPENSLPAFAEAVRHGYGIELDVQLSSDGIPVVFHDATLSRMCSIDRPVWELTYEELKQLTLLNTKETIPSLQEVLRLVDGRVPLLIEIKMDRFRMMIPEKIGTMLDSYQGHYFVESFHPAALWWFRRYRPQIVRGQLSTNFNIENQTVNPFYYLMGKMIFNVVSRPDFISFNVRFHRDLSRRICCSLFGALSVGWVLRRPEQQKKLRKKFALFIFEGFLPQNSTASIPDGKMSPLVQHKVSL